MKKKLLNFYYTFPIQLVILHFKKNVLLLILWVVLVLLFSGGIGKTFGINYLFLDPEYLNNISFWSFFFIGFTFAGFVMAWNITTYLLYSTRFPFLASLSRPFFKFSINNALIPLIFMGIYFYKIATFQFYNGATTLKLTEYLSGFIIGLVSSFLVFMFYFRFTNRDIFSYDPDRRISTPQIIRGLAPKPRQQYKKGQIEENKWPVKYYLTERLKVRYVRSVSHYNLKLLKKVFTQHHNNATILQLLSITLLIILGYSIDYELFRIPAGASILILFAIVTSLLGAMWYWLKGWHTTLIISLLILLNYLTSLGGEKYWNKAYGLTYDKPKVDYPYDDLGQLYPAEKVAADIDSTLEILNRWKARQTAKKPKMILIGTSGGGLRAATWTMRVLQYVDSTLNETLMPRTVLITGASGGPIGAAYYRELYRQKVVEDSTFALHNPIFIDRIARDLQNAIAFTIAVNDVFLPWSFFEKNGQKYPKDRGYIFEKQLIENTKGALDKRLLDYRKPEANAQIPLLFLTPVNALDARRILISPQPIAYMTAPKSLDNLPPNYIYDGVDFGDLFKEKGGYEMQFTSALRMNATYPYILPNVHLPSSPSIEATDAGWRDNFGFDMPARFVHVFKDWIQEHTSGVIFMQIRGSDKIDTISTAQGFIQSLINPLGLVGRLFDLQDYQQTAGYSFLQEILGKENVHLIRFSYRPNQLREEASMSFHLTNREKSDIINAMNNVAYNQQSLKQLLELLRE